MAKIVSPIQEHNETQAARRMIRLDAADVGAIVAMLQCRFKGKGTPNYEKLAASLRENPFYIPESI